MFSLTKKISSYIAIAILVSVVGGGPGLIRDAHAALTPAEISARITALSGLAPSDISEIYAVDRAAFVIILASDIPIPLVLEPKSAYLLIKVAATGEWIRIFIDLTDPGLPPPDGAVAVDRPGRARRASGHRAFAARRAGLRDLPPAPDPGAPGRRGQVGQEIRPRILRMVRSGTAQ